MKQTAMLSNIRIELQDMGETIYTDDELIRAIEKSVSLMSRMLPKRLSIETTVIRSIASESLVIASSTGTLAYKPIRKGSVTITGKVVDIDYQINYLTGVVTELGSRLSDGTYLTTYELDSSMLDLSSFLTDYIKIERVEYPVGNNPPTQVTFDSVGTVLVFRGNVALTETEHLRITYLARWIPPTGDANGDYPSHLDDAVIIGSVGQALIYKAEYYTQKAATNTGAVVTALQAIATTLTMPTLTPPTPPTLATPPTAPTLTMPASPTGYTVAKPSAPSLPSAPTAPTAPALVFTDVDACFTAATAELVGAATRTADKFLEAGALLINAPTRGNNVGSIYGEYANSKVNAAQAHINAGMGRLKDIESTLNLFSTNVASYGSAVNSYANTVSAIIGSYRETINAEALGVSNAQAGASIFASQVNGQGVLVNKYQAEVSSFQSTISAQVSDFQTKVASFQAQVADAQNTLNAFQARANVVVSQVTQLSLQSTQYLDIAGRYLSSGQAKINEMLVSLGIKPEFQMNKASSEQR